MESTPPRVIRCPPNLRADAMRQLHDSLPADRQVALLDALDKTAIDDQTAWDGLFIGAPDNAATGGPTPTGTAWIQPLAGNTAVLWPPAVDAVLAEPLLRAAAAFADEHKYPLVQLLVSEDDASASELFERCQFSKLATLLYLFAEAGPAGVQSEDLELEKRAGDQPERLGALLERTYLGTRDCPALDGVRQMHDVLEGYRAQGEHLPELWYFATAASGDVGALILANHPSAANWELVYMGVVPEARGRGIGERLARFALHAAACGGAERLVLAVDAANEPAIRLYRRLGFVEWDRRVVYARLQPRR